VEDLHEGQRRYIWAENQLGELAQQVALLSSRRFGKTEGFLRLAGSEAGVQKRFRAVAIYQQRCDAREIAWPIVEELAEKYQWDCKLNSVEMAARFRRTGGMIKLFGADDPRRHRQFRGQKNDLVLIDEGQDWYSDVEKMIRGIMPGLADKNGRLFFCGTPGPMPEGYFYEVTAGQHPQWAVIHGSPMENPYTCAELQRQLEEYRLGNPNIDNEPWVKREYHGEWVVDTRANVIHVDPAINYLHEWRREEDDHFLLAIDWGDERAAMTLSTWNRRRYPWLIYLQSRTFGGATMQDYIDRIRYYQATYPKLDIVADPGGVAKSVVHELRIKHGIPIINAEKSDKFAQIQFMNRDLSLGNVKIFNLDDPGHPEDHPLAKEWRNLIWIVHPIKKTREEGKPRDIHDTALYSRRYASPHLWVAAKEPPTEAEQIVAEMRERAAARARGRGGRLRIVR